MDEAAAVLDPEPPMLRRLRSLAIALIRHVVGGLIPVGVHPTEGLDDLQREQRERLRSAQRVVPR